MPTRYIYSFTEPINPEELCMLAAADGLGQ